MLSGRGAKSKPALSTGAGRLRDKGIVSGAGDGARTRDPLLGKIRFRDSYLATPNFYDF